MYQFSHLPRREWLSGLRRHTLKFRFKSHRAPGWVNKEMTKTIKIRRARLCHWKFSKVAENQTALDSSLGKQDTIKAKILCSLEIICRSCSSRSKLFSAIFSDIEITKQFSFGKIILVLYFSWHTWSCDDPHKRMIKKGEMDLHVRC